MVVVTVVVVTVVVVTVVVVTVVVVVVVLVVVVVVVVLLLNWSKIVREYPFLIINDHTKRRKGFQKE